MNTCPDVNPDARTATILRGNVWAMNFLLFALLIDIMYRSIVFREAAWDLFALIGISGVISIAYAAQHNVLIVTRKSLAVLLLTGVVAAVVAALLAMTRAM